MISYDLKLFAIRSTISELHRRGLQSLTGILWRGPVPGLGFRYRPLVEPGRDGNIAGLRQVLDDADEFVPVREVGVEDGIGLVFLLAVRIMLVVERMEGLSLRSIYSSSMTRE